MKATEKKSAANSSTILDKISSKILGLSARVEQVKGRKLEIFVLALYCVLHCVMGVFHEPWLDEAQAWNIARDASLREIFFAAPHFEGHPSLWYLILAPFAKLGMNYEISLCTVTLIVTAMSIYLLLFKSPFPRIIRVTLPFTYFMFYQYGVVARPYCLMILALELMAITYKKRNTEPTKYVLSMVLLCMTCAYGLVLSGGVALVWVIELVRENGITRLLKDKRIYNLLFLLLVAMFIIYQIIPKDALAVSLSEATPLNGLGIRLIYMMFGMIPDGFITNAYGEDAWLRDYPFGIAELVGTCLLGIVILGYICWVGRKKNTLLLFLVPYIFFAVFGASVYLSLHHTGIAGCFILFWSWTTLLNKKDSDKEIKSTTKFVPVVLALMIGMPLIWTISASVQDIIGNYNPAREITKYLADNNMTDMTILVEWPEKKDDEGNLIYYDLKHIADVVNLSAYGYSSNLINWQFEESLFTYYNRILTDEENERIKQSLINEPAPDIIIGEPDLTVVYGDKIKMDDYVQVKRIESGSIWKMLKCSRVVRIYLKKDLVH